MDNAVALVQAYLRVNGYLTVTEFPIVESGRAGIHRTAADIDILAFRFPHSVRMVPRHGRSSTEDVAVAEVDPALAITHREAEMLVGEVKEGNATLNRGASGPAVLRAELTRFGCCQDDHAEQLATELVSRGAARTQSGHHVRLVAFGSTHNQGGGQRRHVILLSQVISYLDVYLGRYWQTLRLSEFKEPGLAFIGVLKKAGIPLRTITHEGFSPSAASPVSSMHTLQEDKRHV